MKTIQKIHFIGICGTAMASLAVLLKSRGHMISGSDANVYPPMSSFLRENGILLMEGYAAEHVDDGPDLVVIGNALSRGNSEVEAVLAKRLPYISMAELLKRYFIEGKISLVISGTHGKTTTTSLTATLFDTAQLNPGFMIGGIPQDFGTSCREGTGPFFIVEGDEYDTAFFDKRSKFFHYLPTQLVINNIEFDHADIFDSLDVILTSFRYLLRLVPNNGLVVANGDDPNVMKLLEGSVYSPVITFGFGKNCEVRAQNIEISEAGSRFQFIWKDRLETEFHMPLVGEHNVRNAMAAIILALHNGISPEVIQQGLSKFQGVKRRLELRGCVNGVSVYDDFAHHPTAIYETLKAVKAKHPGQRILAVFEPRSNTSVRRVHQKAMETAFDPADGIVLARPHRADQIPAESRLDVDALITSFQAQGKVAASFEDTTEIIQYLIQIKRPQDVIIIMSNGKFGNIHQQLLESL